MIATGTLRLPSRRFEDRLSISAAPLFAFKLLLPRLHKFRELYPNMVVTVDGSSNVVQLPSDQFDVAIRNSRDASPKLSCDLIGRIRFVPVGTPTYIHELSQGGTVDWSRATLIHTAAASEDWETWCNHSQTDTSAARKLIVSSAQLALEAAADGLGIAIGRMPLISDEISSGRLAVAVDHVVPVMSGYWLVKPPGIETRREVVAFRNWLLKEMGQLNWNGNHADARATSQSA
jgi:DNA-binding transcriptional LysR family regulator